MATNIDENADLSAPAVQVAPVDGLGRVDLCIAGFLAVIVFAALSLWSYPILYPAVWNDAAVAAKLHPAASVFPGLWRVIVGGIYAAAGIGKTAVILQVVGKVVAAGTVALVYLLLRECLALSIRNRPQHARRRVQVARGAAMLATLAFAFSAPFWRSGQTFSVAALEFFLFALVLELFVWFLRSGSMGSIYVAVFFAGILSAETPVGFALVAICWIWYLLVLRNVVVFQTPLLDPAVEQVSKWHLTFLYMAGLALVIGLNCVSFLLFNGGTAAGTGSAALPLAYIQGYWGLVTGAASPLGWAILLAVVILPCVISAVLMPVAADEERFLKYGVGLLFLVCGALTLSQLAELRALWCWTWVKGAVLSPFLLLIVVFLCALTFLNALAVFGVDALCRDHKKLADLLYGSSDEEEEAPRSRLSRRVGVFVRRGVSVLIPLAVLAACVPGRREAKAREMMTVVRDCMDETVRECEGCRWVFTDGWFDTGLEFVAAAKGQKLHALSLMAGNSPREVYMRWAGLEDDEDLLTAQNGGATMLRTWLRDKPARLAQSAIQIGFEFWKRDGKPLPPFSGLLARTGGLTKESAAAGVKAAIALADRILKIYGKSSDCHGLCDDPVICDLFLAVQWRISRIARLRGETLDLAGSADAADAEVSLSDSMDAKNVALQEILEKMERVRQTSIQRISPREGLQMALLRADFKKARLYAEPILNADPENEEANYAMAMSYYDQGQYSRAEQHLTRCLIRAPKEPAVYNNLAMTQIRLRKFDAAEQNAKRAIELSPETPQIIETLREVREARAAAASGKAAAPAAPTRVSTVPVGFTPPPPVKTGRK